MRALTADDIIGFVLSLAMMLALRTAWDDRSTISDWVFDYPKKALALFLGGVGVFIGGVVDGYRGLGIGVFLYVVIIVAYRRWTPTKKKAKITTDAEPSSEPSITDDPRCVAGGGVALKVTPSDEQAIRFTVDYMRKDNAEAFPGTPAEFCLPLGWELGEDGKPSLIWTKFGVGCDSLLITGLKNSGKDNCALWQVLTLAEQHTPDELQFIIMDTKGVDWGIFAGKAHVKSLFVGADHVKAAMTAITSERERRVAILQTYKEQGIRKWAHIPNRPPFLVIIITEITLIIQAVGKNEAMTWLNAELVSWRAFGGYCVLLTQVVNNMDTTFRGQIDIFMGAAQNRDTYDEPNTMFGTKDILKAGCVPPSQLPPVPMNAGVFLVASPSMRLVTNTRSSFISDAALVRILSQHPNVDEDDPWAARVAEIAAPKLPDEKNKAKSMSDDDIVEYIIDRLASETPDNRITRRVISLELWGHSGGSGPNGATVRLLPLWERAHRERNHRVPS